MKILVTGGAGFIGSHIVDAYINNGHDVVIIDNFYTGVRKNVNPKARLYECNIQDEQVSDIFRTEKFDIVNHQAAQMDVRKSVSNPIFDAKNNILGFINILQNGVENDVKKVIFASSGGAIYGEQDYFPANEVHPLQPSSPYGITKLTGEKYLSFYAGNYGLSYVALRYANVYGPRQNPRGEAGVVAIFCDRMLSQQKAVINGDGKQTRDFVYVKDVVQANVLAADFSGNGIFNIGTGEETTINKIFNTVKELLDSDMPEEHGPAQPGEQRRSVISPRKAFQKLSWQPRYDLKQGLNETVEFFKQNH
ncbi:NAD-dependent epimerase/dehydratase family protein [candidate division KSB1 bacterium]|nr:NAD-dependent epimerase/dehydratase family protein [candidate division KSB1 bacterium]